MEVKQIFTLMNTVTGSGVGAVNLLKLYNDKFSVTLTPAQAVTNPEFIRFSAYIMELYQRYMTQQMLDADSAYWNKVTSPFYHQVINDIVSEITYKISPVEMY